MASTISTVNESLVDSKVVKALRYILPALKLFSHVFEQTGRIQNDILYVPIGTDPTAGAKTAGTIVSGTGTVAGTAVTLDTFEGAGWDCYEGQMRKDLFAEYWADKVAGGVYVVAKAVIDALTALVTAANYGDTADDKLAVALADMDTRNLGLLATLAAKKIRQRNRGFLVNAGHGYQLLGQSTLGTIFAFGGNNVLQSGEIPQLMGMPTLKYDALSDNSENLAGFIFGQAALLLGMAPPDPLAAGGQGNIVERRVITDPESNLSVMYTMTADGGGAIKGEVCTLFGVKKGQNAIVRLVSA
jgi:hypothetical protein